MTRITEARRSNRLFRGPSEDLYSSPTTRTEPSRETMPAAQTALCLCLLTALAPAVLSEHETHQQPRATSPADTEQCATCEVRQQIKSMRLNAIKSQILSKLRMKEAPNISREVVQQLLPKAPPLQQLLDQYDVLGDDNGDVVLEDDDEHATTETVMIMATEPKSSVQLDGQPKCCFFSFSNKLQANRIVSAQLWFQLRPADEATTVFLQISRLSPVADGTRHIRIRSLKIEVSAGVSSWRRIDVKQVVAVWLRQPETNWGVEIKAFDSRGNDLAVTSAEPGEEGLQPFMEVKLSQGPKRVRRDPGLDCDEKSLETRCCRYPLMVDFEDLGYGWIIAPKRYKANYCSGECEHMHLQMYPHTHLVNKANPKGIGPCCTSTKMSSISILYYDQNQQIVYGKIPSMVVDRCGCS